MNSSASWPLVVVPSRCCRYRIQNDGELLSGLRSLLKRKMMTSRHSKISEQKRQQANRVTKWFWGQHESLSCEILPASSVLSSLPWFSSSNPYEPQPYHVPGHQKGLRRRRRRSLTVNKVLWILFPRASPFFDMAKTVEGGYNATDDGDNSSMVRGGVLTSTAGC